MNIINKKIELSDGRVIEIETGKLAKQAEDLLQAMSMRRLLYFPMI